VFSLGSGRLSVARIIEEFLEVFGVDLAGTVKGIYRVYGEAKARSYLSRMLRHWRSRDGRFRGAFSACTIVGEV